ncbi:MAG: hypothetical protein LBO71_11120 [Prevotellaceae bacterium]|jgi:hypothetical protein|nr:hypothetical protein [Prevotellaceae bacterium]
MKRCLLTLAVCFLSVTFYGQEAAQPVNTRSGMELSYAQSLWFHTSNAAGIAVTPLRSYSILSAQYAAAAGDYKLQQEGDKNRSMGFNTSGALRLGKLRLWGDFTFADSYVTGATYNTNRYEPKPDMPYYVADPNKSDWTKQCYDMALKAALPVWRERLVVGAEAHYTVKRAAKQLDPRSTVHGYDIAVKPSVVAKIAQRQHAGISLWYQNAFDRNTFTNSLSYHNEPVYIMKGLGSYSPDVVGGIGGIGVFYYPSYQYGGGLQYGITGSNTALLLDITGAKQKTEAFEAPSKPRRRGAADNTTIAATLQLIRSGSNTHKITVNAGQSATDGIEHVQEYDSRYEVNQWITIAEYVKSSYRRLWASLRYDLFAGVLHDYSWKAGVKTLYSNRQDEYLTPHSVFNAQNSYTELFAAKNFAVGASSKILFGLQLGYKLNIGGEYLYNGAEASSLLVTDFYPKDLSYLTRHYASVGGKLSWSFVVKSKSSIDFTLAGQWIKPAGATSDRLFIKAEAAYIF